jgi:hypothetical protein
MPPPPTDPNVLHTAMDDISWFCNRLTIFLAQTRLLSAAAAIHASLAFRSATAWLAAQPGAKLDRLKLGSIRRAQPYSRYFVAGWTHLRHKQQVTA